MCAGERGLGECRIVLRLRLALAMSYTAMFKQPFRNFVTVPPSSSS